jgi:hypothetical protein
MIKIVFKSSFTETPLLNELKCFANMIQNLYSKSFLNRLNFSPYRLVLSN